MWPSEEGGGLLHPAGGQGRAHPGRGDGLTGPVGALPVSGQGHPVDDEPGRRPHLLQQGHVPLAAVAEVEVLAYDHQPGVEPLDQDLCHEVLRRLVGPLPVEGHHHHQVHPGRLEQLEPLRKITEKAGCRLGPHHHGRMAVEGDHRRRQAVGRGPGRQLAQQGPVAEVNPVVGPDGDRRAPGRGSTGRRVGHDLHHRGRLPGPPRRQG